MKAHFSTAARTLAQLAAVAAVSLGPSAPAHAVDGCKLLLCMAGNWQSIGQCVPTVRQALRDVARGRAWPTCNMSGSSGSGNQFVAPEQCPAQYVTEIGSGLDGVAAYTCPFIGVIHLAVEGQAWSRTWWSPSGDAVTEWLPAAKAAFATSPDSMNAQFDRDFAAWTVSEQARRDALAAALASGGGG